MSEDAAYFEEKARQCFSLADACPTPDVALSLRQLGYDFVARAIQLGVEPATVPRPMYGAHDPQ